MEFSHYTNNIFHKNKYQVINIFRLLAVTVYRDSEIKIILKYINFMVFGNVVETFTGRRYD